VTQTQSAGRIITAVIITAFMLTGTPLLAKTPTTFAVLPFTINANKDMSYVPKGISRMFYSRLSWPDKVQVIKPNKIAAVLKDFQGRPENEIVKAVADKTGSQYILSGSVTQVAGSFSIDARVFDIENKRYMSFFEQSKESDDLIERVDRIAASINNKIFERNTLTWNKMEQEKRKKLNDYKRKNPQHLMKLPPGYQPDENVGWKVWKYLF